MIHPPRAAARRSRCARSDLGLQLQFSVKHEQDIDCGGGYLKVVPASRFVHFLIDALVFIAGPTCSYTPRFCPQQGQDG
jgi:hypothetical protein